MEKLWKDFSRLWIIVGQSFKYAGENVSSGDQKMSWYLGYACSRDDLQKDLR